MSELKDALDEWIAQRLPVVIVPGTVKAVRVAEEMCDVQPDNEDALVEDVALLNGIFPAVGSQVLIGRVENRPTDTFLISADAVTHFRLATEQESFLTWAEDFIDELLLLTVPTPAGPSGPPMNAPQLRLLKNRLANLFLA